MAAPTFIGYVTVWGIDGTMAYTGMATADNILEGMSYEDGTKEHETKDKQGETIGLRLWDPKKTLTVNFYPGQAAGTGSIAAAKLEVDLPARGSKVTIASMPAAGSPVFDTNGTTWLYVGGGRIEFGNEQECKMVLPLRRYNTDIAATANS